VLAEQGLDVWKITGDVDRDVVATTNVTVPVALLRLAAQNVPPALSANVPSPWVSSLWYPPPQSCCRARRAPRCRDGGTSGGERKGGEKIGYYSYFCSASAPNQVIFDGEILSAHFRRFCRGADIVTETPGFSGMDYT
jgi:hypothetical protein